MFAKVFTFAGMAAVVAVATAAQAQPDPRTAAGQLAACGGAAAWSAVGYLEFTVTVDGADAQTQGPWTYRWDRRSGFVRFTGPGPDGRDLDVAIEVSSRTGGGWADGKQLMGPDLAEAVSWAADRFANDVLWLTFPLEWGASGVTVTALPDVTADDAPPQPAVDVRSSMGRWNVLLDPATGRIARTVFSKVGTAPVTATWTGWEEHAGVMFATGHDVPETGGSVSVAVLQALPSAPRDAF